jgi:hypothetical protein
LPYVYSTQRNEVGTELQLVYGSPLHKAALAYTFETYRDDYGVREDPIWGEKGVIWGEKGVMSNFLAGNYYISVHIQDEEIGQELIARDGETAFVELRTQR